MAATSPGHSHTALFLLGFNKNLHNWLFLAGTAAGNAFECFSRLAHILLCSNKGLALFQLSDISFNIMVCEYNLSHFMGYNITSAPLAARLACGMNSGQGILVFTLISCQCWLPVQSCHKSRIENAALAKPDAGEIFPNKRCMKKNYYVTGTSREELVQNVNSAGLCGWLLMPDKIICL